MSRSAGAGVPLTFQCSKCRANIGPRAPCRESDGTWLCSHEQYRSGRTKKVRGRQTTRLLPEAHEYTCDCGHVGWSRHAGVLRLAVALPASVLGSGGLCITVHKP